MSYEFSNHKRVYVAIESTFGAQVDFSSLTAGASNYKSLVPVMEGTLEFTAAQDVLDPMPLQTHKFDRYRKTLGKRSGTLKFSIPFYSTATAANNGQAQVPSTTSTSGGFALGVILKSVMGGEDNVTGTNWGGGGSASAPTTSANTFQPMNAVCYQNASSAYEWRVVDTSATSPYNMKLAYSATPTGTAWAANTYYLTQDSGTNDSTSLQFLVQGAEADDAFQFLGCQLTNMSFETGLGTLPKITFEFSCATWVQDSEITAAPPSFSGGFGLTTFSPIADVAGEMLQWTNGTTTYTASTGSTEGSQVHVAKESFTCSLGFTPVTSPSGVQTIQQYVRRKADGGPIMTGTFDAPYHSTFWKDFKSNRTALGLQRTFGGTPGSTLILCMPTVQIVDVQPVDASGLRYQTVTWEARNDTDTGGTTDQEVSAFSIHLG
jgi:hypothetical protein